MLATMGMSPWTRLLRLLRAACTLGRLNRTADARVNQPAELVRCAFQFCDGFLAPVQVEGEIAQLVDDVIHLRPRRILEIGTSMGGTLYLWTRVSDPEAVILSVDLPRGPFGGGYSRLRSPLYRRFARHRQRIHLLRADSHSPETQARVRALLGDAPLDFLFIDGDHTYEGVRQDWQSYGPMVRKGGLVAFHDVAREYEDTAVKRFWDQVKNDFRYREYLSEPNGFYGIGVLEK